MPTKSGAGYPHGRWAVCLSKQCRRCRAGATCQALWLAAKLPALLRAVRLQRRPEVLVRWRDQ